MHQTALFFQGPPPGFPWAVVLLAALGVVLAVKVVFLAILIRHFHTRRGWEHDERMRALSLGVPPEPREALWPRAAVCLALGLFLPLGAFALTCLAYLQKPGAADEIWVAPAVVGALGVIGSSILAGFLLHRPGAAPEAPEAKPFDRDEADAFDVVSRRG